MKVVKPKFTIEDFDGKELLRKLERIGRVCYKSEDKITEDSAETFVQMLIKRGHEAMLEHDCITVNIVCDRGVSHELVRHRLASYAQESTRYCNYAKEKFDSEVTFILPEWFEYTASIYNAYHQAVLSGSTKQFDYLDKAEKAWMSANAHSEDMYLYLIKNGWSAQQARGILTNSLKTEIVMTMNPREWRLFFKLRANPAAHPQMQEIAYPLLREFKKRVPVLFDDLNDERAGGN